MNSNQWTHYYSWHTTMDLLLFMAYYNELITIHGILQWTYYYSWHTTMDLLLFMAYYNGLITVVRVLYIYCEFFLIRGYKFVCRFYVDMWISESYAIMTNICWILKFVVYPPSHCVHSSTFINNSVGLYVPAGQSCWSNPVPPGQYRPRGQGSALTLLTQ
jgi:hypothetical protein